MECKVSKGTIHYEIQGEGFPIVILHAMGTDHRSMKAWVEPIFDKMVGFQRVYVDLPAHGGSVIDESVTSTDDMLENLLEFIDAAMENHEFLLIGSSFGGYLAQGILHKRRNQAKGICLLAPALHLKERTLPERIVFEKDEDLLETLNSDVRTAFETLFNYQNKKNIVSFMDEIQPGRLLADREFLSSDWKTKRYFLSEEPFYEEKALPHPALFLLGKQDYICGYKDHQHLAQKFPNSTFAVIDKAGHMLQIEKREAVQLLLKDWLISSY
ncbi:alpha/beta hydrolase [Bacillus sp. JJ1122]|uniref:alpha/beta fold hydrolase n=1 Tax=Bacillus sp. JJ1122 TaxID=3122951 RepID=UPI003000304A